MRVPGYICPSDRNDIIGTGAAARWAPNYMPSRGPTPANNNNAACSCNQWAALRQTYGSAGHTAWNFHDVFVNPAGLFTRANVALVAGQPVYTGYFGKINHATDGLSNRIVFGEVRAECSDHVQLGWDMPHGTGLSLTIVPINFNSCAATAALAPGGDGCYARCNFNMEWGFKSLHPGGAQFGLGDGSTHFISQTIDHWVYNYLGDKDDGKPVSLP